MIKKNLKKKTFFSTIYFRHSPENCGTWWREQEVPAWPPPRFPYYYHEAFLCDSNYYHRVFLPAAEGFPHTKRTDALGTSSSGLQGIRRSQLLKPERKLSFFLLFELLRSQLFLNQKESYPSFCYLNYFDLNFFVLSLLRFDLKRFLSLN